MSTSNSVRHIMIHSTDSSLLSADFFNQSTTSITNYKFYFTYNIKVILSAMRPPC